MKTIVYSNFDQKLTALALDHNGHQVPADHTTITFEIKASQRWRPREEGAEEEDGGVSFISISTANGRLPMEGI